MKYASTRNAHTLVDASEAIIAGLAPDGGLYVPTAFPHLTADDFPADADLATTARVLLAPFLAQDRLGEDLEAICAEAFTFEAPLLPIEDRLSVLELFHGPTAAFKDFGARFLAACFARAAQADAEPVRILVATSGDTGGAVAAAFHGRPGMAVDVFYPAGQVSPRQEQQLTCWGDNVRAFRVAGNFDACQALVKAAFADAALRGGQRLSSANSINLGRLLPQMVYYAWASVRVWRTHGRSASFVVPTGNLGNALACVWARACGLPIDRIHLATNANRTIVDFLASGQWQPRASVATLANAMDVGNPSNMERLRSLYVQHQLLEAAVGATWVSDEQIRAQIKRDVEARQQVWCPHTATALYAFDAMDLEQRNAHEWVAVATAHPAKFETVVEPLIGRTIEVPMNLATLLDKPSHKIDLAAELDALRGFYR